LIQTVHSAALRFISTAWIYSMTDPQKPPSEEEDERDRRAGNIFLLVAAVIFIGGGIWLVNAMVDARHSEECFESGRRNCNPISVEPSR
jgi:hypothetical protein